MLHRMTEGNLKAAFAGESQVHMRHLIFAEVAEREGKPNTARLFRVIAYAEKVHAQNHPQELGVIKGTPENLSEAIAGGPSRRRRCTTPTMPWLQEEQGAQRADHYALEAERLHAQMYRKAKETAGRGGDLKLRTIYICPVYVYTVEGEAPERCPVCGAPREKFESF